MRKLIVGAMGSVGLLLALAGCGSQADHEQEAELTMPVVTPVTQLVGERAWTDLVDHHGKVVAVVELDFQAKLAAMTGPGSNDISFNLAELSAEQLPATVDTANQLALSAYQASQKAAAMNQAPTATAGDGEEPIGKSTSAVRFGWRCEWCGDQDLAYRCLTCGFCGNYECWYIDLEN